MAPSSALGCTAFISPAPWGWARLVVACCLPRRCDVAMIVLLIVHINEQSLALANVLPSFGL
jgi:hypothetical protein